VSLSAPGTSPEETITRQYRDDDRRLMTTIDRINLNEAIGDLPERYRTAVILFHLEGYGHNEIARIMNWSVATSKSHLHRARRSLQKWLRLHGQSRFSMNRVKAANRAKTTSVLRERAA